MYGQIHFLKALQVEIERLRQLISYFTARQKQLPQGYLSFKHGYFYRVVRIGEKVESIIISNEFSDGEALMAELMERRYISKALPILTANLKSCEKLLRRFQLYDPVQIIQNLPAHYSGLDLSALMLSGDIDPIQWASAPYTHNTIFPEHLKYKSEGGLVTRSKAEADIATKLEQNHLSFRYEPVLKLGGHTLSPDFCVLHPVLRRQIYWEHFGKMDDPMYASNTMGKLQAYSEHGYRLGDNLIMTWETKNKPLTFERINTCIARFLS